MDSKKSFFERLTGATRVVDDEIETQDENWIEESNEEGQLSVDVFQTANEVVIKAMTAGVKPDDLDVEINQEMVTIQGERKDASKVEKDNYFSQELYWGRFSRTILLPQEIDPSESDATIKDGMLIIRMPKMDKRRVQKLKIK